jgi:hypothetical protein
MYLLGWEKCVWGQCPNFLYNLIVSKGKSFFPSCQLDMFFCESILICVSLRSPMTVRYLVFAVHFLLASVPGINSTAKRIKLMITLSQNQTPIHFKICLNISPIQLIMRSSKMIEMQGSYQSLLQVAI